MFGRKRETSDSVDVNDFIVGDNMQGGLHINGDLGSPVPSIDITDDQIIDADYATDPKTGKRFKTSQVVILAAVAVFAVGGIASIFIPTGQPEALPQVAVALPKTPAASEAEIKLPPGLADTPLTPTTTADASAPLQEPTAVPTSTPASLATVSQEPSAAPLPVALPPANPAPAVVAQPPVPTAASLASSAPAPTQQATPVAPAPQVTAPQAATPANPLTAQIAEAQRMQPVAPAPKVVEKPVATAPKAVEKPAPAPQKATPAPVAQKKETAAQNAPKGAAPVQPKPKSETATRASHAAEHESSEETIKRLVTTTADAFGLQAIQEGSITLESRRGAGSQRLHVGDRLPSGEQILRIDARSMTLVTDRSVIRIN